MEEDAQDDAVERKIGSRDGFGRGYGLHSSEGGGADEESEDQMHAVGLEMKPSEFWRRQGFTTFQQEATAADFVHLVGEDNVIWGSDYPHPDGVWPNSKKVIEDDMGRLDETVRRKLTRDNTGKLYRMFD